MLITKKKRILVSFKMLPNSTSKYSRTKSKLFDAENSFFNFTEYFLLQLNHNISDSKIKAREKKKEIFHVLIHQKKDLESSN